MNPPKVGAIIHAKMRKAFPRGPPGKGLCKGPPKICISRILGGERSYDSAKKGA
jgi:hypothetical protein